LNRDLAEDEGNDYSACSKAMNKASDAKTKANTMVVHVTYQIFQLYPNLLLEEVRQPWSKILVEQIGCHP
jgi:hypothetical protein